jgi:hypothetical protein
MSSKTYSLPVRLHAQPGGADGVSIGDGVAAAALAALLLRVMKVSYKNSWLKLTHCCSELPMHTQRTLKGTYVPTAHAVVSAQSQLRTCAVPDTHPVVSAQSQLRTCEDARP